jgi:prepilin-type N-terminal cleavage/methylation domain-containing protein
MIPLNSKRSRSREGFTLLEVLLASVILAVVMVLLLGMGNGIVRLWQDSEQRRESLREARSALQILTEDLHSAVITTNPESLLIERSPRGQEGDSDRLFFLVSHASDRRNEEVRGDLCASGYFIARNHEGHRDLYRFHASGNGVAIAVKQDRLMNLYALASPTNEASTELLARNIMTFRVRQLPEHSDPPEALEITIEAINGSTERLLSAEPLAVERNQRLIKRHLQRYSEIIHLPPMRESAEKP